MEASSGMELVVDGAAAPGVPGAEVAADGGFGWGANGEALALVSEEVARKHTLLPLRKEGHRLVVAMADPSDFHAIEDVEARSRLEVAPVRAEPQDIVNAIDLYYSAVIPQQILTGADGGAAEVASDTDGPHSGEATALAGERDDPVVRTVDSLIGHAAKARATDVHIEPCDNLVKVRFRIDGFLHEVASFPIGSLRAILSRIKVVAGMNITERRRPQDGHFSITVGEKELDVRVASAETMSGEMVSLRLLERTTELLSLTSLGLMPQPLGLLRQMLCSSYGLLLAAGPTGSGKTTTLYSALNEMDRAHRKVITIEDPVEYRLPAVNSMQINEKIGVTFPSALRAILRLDPDVIMVGEIRDGETARIAVQAALTGHQVLTSIHANDAPQAVIRLLDLGIEPFLLSSAIVGVVAQRMVRKVCPYCRVPDSSAWHATGAHR